MAIDKITTASITDANITTAKIASGVLPANTPYFNVYRSSNQTGISDDTNTVAALDQEYYDSAGAYNTSTYRFTPQTAGKYLIEVSLQFAAGGSQLLYCYAYIYKNGSSTKISQNDFQNNPANTHNATASYIIDMNGSSDYVEAYGHIYNAGTVGASDGGAKQSVFKGYKIIE